MSTDYPPATILGTHTRMLHSNIANDDYELSIWLPSSYYSSKEAYPVLYVLDSPAFFGSSAWNILFQNWDADIPEIIVIGVGKQITNLDEWSQIRNRDYALVPRPDSPGSGQGENFLEFIGQELIPFIDENYRTQPGDRIILGQSMSGSFAIHALFSQPNLFSRCIATAPSFVDSGDVLVDYKQALSTASFPSEVRLFISIVSLDHTYSPQAEAFAAAVAAKDIPNLMFQKKTIEGLGHTAAAMPGFLYGIEAVYKM